MTSVSQKQNKKRLYLNLAKDAMATAEREAKYARIALNEKKYSKKDKMIATKKHQPARSCDDIFEIDIDKEFYNYRMGVAKHYKDVAVKYRKMASKL